MEKQRKLGQKWAETEPWVDYNAEHEGVLRSSGSSVTCDEISLMDPGRKVDGRLDPGWEAYIKRPMRKKI